MHSKAALFSFVSPPQLYGESHEMISETDDSSTASTSSTIPVNHHLKRPIDAVDETAGRRDGKKRKCVSFDLHRNEVVAVPSFTASRSEAESATITRDSWYNREDYKRFKRSTHGLARLISCTEIGNRSRNSYGRVLERAQMLCIRQSAAVSIAEETRLQRQRQQQRQQQQQRQHEEEGHDVAAMRLPQSALVADDSTADELGDECRVMSLWVVGAVGRVGLERLAVRRLRREAKTRRSLVLERVLSLQQIQRLKYVGMDGNDDDRCCDNEWMRRYCEQVTRPSQLMAQFLAEAQAEALLIEAA